MPSQQPLAIAFSQKDVVSQIVPCEPLVLSDGLGWSGIQFEYHRQSAYETPEVTPEQHVIAIVVGQSHLNERKENGQFKAMYHRQSDILLHPAKRTIQHRWHSEVEFIHLYLEPKIFVQIAEDLPKSASIELLPQVGIRDSLVQEIGLALKSELETGGSSSRLYAESAVTFLVTHLLQHYSIHQQILRDYAEGLSKYKLQQAIDYIQAHLAEDISLEAIATELGMSRYYFCRLFKQSTGISPHQYVIKCRIDRAKDLLLQGHKSIADVAFQVGFSSQSHFTKHFKRLVGVTPKQISN